MENYILVVRGADPARILPTKEDVTDFMNQWLAWRTLLDEQGRLVLSTQLDYGGKVIYGSGKELLDEPIKTNGKIIGGYLLIKAGSMDEAVEVSMGCPALRLDGIVEVRAFKNVFHGGAFMPAG
jgi:hypothetical protein